MPNQFEPITKLEGVTTALQCKNFSFAGFGQVPSRCSLLLLATLDDKRITVCSQPLGRYLGTSVTNAFELILDALRAEKGSSGLAALWRRGQSPSQWGKWEAEKSIWLEHYPLGTSVLEGQYTLMSVSLRSGHPSWGPNSTWERMAERLRVPARTLALGYESELKPSP